MDARWMWWESWRWWNGKRAEQRSGQRPYVVSVSVPSSRPTGSTSDEQGAPDRPVTMIAGKVQLVRDRRRDLRYVTRQGAAALCTLAMVTQATPSSLALVAVPISWRQRSVTRTLSFCALSSGVSATPLLATARGLAMVTASECVGAKPSRDGEDAARPDSHLCASAWVSDSPSDRPILALIAST